MKKPRIYVDTSVIGGCFDPEFSKWSNILFNNFKDGLYTPLTSDVVANEISQSPKYVQDKYLELLNYKTEVVKLNNEIFTLRKSYQDKEILKAKYSADLLHIAIATFANSDVLVSWNFKHIVRFDKIILYNSVNNELGYKSIQIYSPREVARDEKE